MGNGPASTLFSASIVGMVGLELLWFTSQEDYRFLLVLNAEACWMLMFGRCVILSLCCVFISRAVLNELRVFRDELRASRDTRYFEFSMALLVLKRFCLVTSFLLTTWGSEPKFGSNCRWLCWPCFIVSVCTSIDTFFKWEKMEMKVYY